MGSSSSPHVLILPFPAQGHVIPLMELSHCLVDRGFKVTFVNTDFNHHRVAAAAASSKSGGKALDDQTIRLVSIPDGLGPGEDRNDIGRLCEGMLEVMPRCLEELIRNTNNKESEEEIRWMIADENMGWAFEVSKRMGIRAAAFWPVATALLATFFSIPKLIEDGIIGGDGLPIRHDIFHLTPGMPPMDPTQFSWNITGRDSAAQKIIFSYILRTNQASKHADFIICNSFLDLEPSTFSYMPTFLPIGPIIAGLNKPAGNFWASDDTACMTWLDEQPTNSVIYVAFGSFTVLDQTQFQELAFGLELSGRPFLWVVRPDNMTDNSYPIGFRDRVADRGRMVDWSPQQKVLAHPSVACFLTHCGWNSTIEGVRNGVRLLCWPYFCDQFLHQSYICDVWRIGLRLVPDGGGIVSRERFKEKVEELLGDEGLRARSLMWKEKATESVKKGGSSYENFNMFVSAMKE